MSQMIPTKGGSFFQGGDEERKVIEAALYLLPIDIVGVVLRECTMFVIPEGCGHYLSSQVLEGRSLILLSEKLLTDRDAVALWFALFHEVAHHVLHENVVRRQSIEEREAAETDATKLALKWMDTAHGGNQWRDDYLARTEELLKGV